MLKNKIQTIIFDVDGTLTDFNSWTRINQELDLSPQKHLEIFEKMKEGEYSLEEAKSKLVYYWKSSGNADRKYFIKIFKNWKFDQEVKDLISYLNKKYQICLISGSIELYIEEVALKLGIKDWYANASLVFNDKGKLLDIDYTVDQAEKKLEQAKEYIKNYGFSKDQCLAVGDGENDIRLFSFFDYSINKGCQELNKYAYKTIHRLDEIRKLL
ncbi:HAD-IB family phosphatase [Candidatus Dojkabacteria bacterium]|nr:HAD-IB family phosphatase [Candidatus Dojkabacteria bacterium]